MLLPPRQPSYLRNAFGFTLVELIFTMMILAVISIVVGRVLFQGYNTMLTSEKISTTGWQGLISLNKITNDIHRIRSTSDISTISSNQLAFTDVAGNSVTYSLSSGNLLRNGAVLASGVQSLAFTYLNSSGSSTSTAANVRYIKMTLGLVSTDLTLSMSTMAGVRL